MRLVTLRRCVLESRLDPDECAARLRRSTYRLRPWFWDRRPFVGRVSVDRFSLREWRRRALPPRADGSISRDASTGSEIRLELGIARLELIPQCLVATFFGLGLVGVPADPEGLVFALLAVAWLAWFASELLRWNRRADELVARLCAVCEVQSTRLSESFS